MYTAPQKAFRARDEAEVMEMIRRCGEQFGGDVRRVPRRRRRDGAADAPPAGHSGGDLYASAGVHRISSYCLPRNLRKKSQYEIDALAAAGLAMVYVGAESGDDAVLAAVNKGETFDTTREALEKLGAAGITRSVMILNGLGGQGLSAQHADNSARLMNATQPEYLSTLVVSFPMGEARYRAAFPGWEALDQHGLFVELERFIGGLELKRTVFRSDHASNWLPLKGTLGADKVRLLAELRQAIEVPGKAPAWRGRGALAAG